MKTQRSGSKRPTLDEIRQWPATVSVAKSALALGVSRSHAYEHVRLGTYPARVIHVGNRATVVTSSILALLDAPEV